MTDIPDTLRSASPATKLVYRTLEAADTPLTYDMLVERTGLGRRTVRRCTDVLADHDLAEPLWLTAQERAYRSAGEGAGQPDQPNGI